MLEGVIRSTINMGLEHAEQLHRRNRCRSFASCLANASGMPSQDKSSTVFSFGLLPVCRQFACGRPLDQGRHWRPTLAAFGY
jgi:hypothetical protein